VVLGDNGIVCPVDYADQEHFEDAIASTLVGQKRVDPKRQIK
jgi:hypothetical protein